MDYKEVYRKGMGWKKLPLGYDIHHIIPKAEGGTDEFDNLVLVCKCDHQLFTIIQCSKNNSETKIAIGEQKLQEWLDKKDSVKNSVGGILMPM